MTAGRTLPRGVAAAVLLAAGLWLATPPARAAQSVYDVCWSHYTGWEPWAYAEDHGILQKWADKYHITIHLTLVPDYIESVKQYTAGRYHGCAMTNMDALTLPAVEGVDSTALIIGDFSNGNDGIVLKGGQAVTDLKGKKVLLVQRSVSRYLLARALALSHLSEKDVTLVNASEHDLAPAFLAARDGAVVTWNPILLNIRNTSDARLVFDSSRIPGEIVDLLVVRTDAPDALKKALTGAWYETLAIMSRPGKESRDALAAMAAKAGATLAEFQAQLRTTAMFYQAAEADRFARSARLKDSMEFVRRFAFERGLYGAAASADAVGIALPDGSVLGDRAHIKLRFDATYMQQAAEGKL
jgi:NitT/TauT family transport system substrate-binding protein